MSFVVPAWVLWLQAAYSLWTFLRNAKFFRIPFISMSMLWHGYDRTWFKQRKYLLLDGKSREAGGDWPDYDNDQYKESHSFSIENSYDMRFQLNNKKYRFCASFETGKPLKFLHFAKNYHLATEDIVLMGKYHLVKAVKPEAMLKYILMGGNIKTVEEYCIVDNTSSELLNANFMRILSIFPLILHANGFGRFSTLVSALFVVIDLFSFYFNFVWQGVKTVTFQYAKLFLATFKVKYRVFIHELLSTGSDSFMFCDDSVKKAYYKSVDKFMVVRGCEIPLEATTAPLPNDADGDLPPHQEIKMNLNTFVEQTEMVAPLPNDADGDLPPHQEIKMNLNTFVEQTEMVAPLPNDADGDLPPHQETKMNLNTFVEQTEMVAPLPNDADGDLPPHQEIKMNLNTFIVQTVKVAEENYNITITDSNNYRETRMMLSKNFTRKIINYLMYCKKTDNYPFRDLSPHSVHVVNPIKVMVDGIFDWALTVQLEQKVRLFFS